MHFEMSSKDLRVENLTRKWDDAVLGVGEHPDKLWTELTSINQNLKKLGEEFKDSHFTRRFVAGIKGTAQPPIQTGTYAIQRQCHCWSPPQN